MHCHATYRGGRGRVPSESCGRFLGYVPGVLTFVGLGTRAPDEPDGNVWVRCPRSDCHAWNIFKVMPPDGER
jgi:hypothetical protein